MSLPIPAGGAALPRGSRARPYPPAAAARVAFASSAVVLALLAGCGHDAKHAATCPTPRGVSLRFDVAAAGDDAAASWLASPFPSDHRRTAAGTIDLHDFPNPKHVALVDGYTAVAAAELDGFSTTAAAYLSFTDAIDTSALPTDPAAYLSAGAPMALVDVTAGSPEYGRRRPLRWRWNTTAGVYLPGNTLAVAPAWGFPLREHTTYALLVTSAVHDGSGNPLAIAPEVAALVGTGPSCMQGIAGTALATASGPALRAWLSAAALDPANIVAATVFTTQTVTSGLDAIAAQLAAAPAPAYEDAWQPIGGPGVPWVQHTFTWQVNPSATVSYYLLEGRFSSPNYQSGAVPYTTGGGLSLAGGVPAPVRTESLRFVLSVPAAPPAGGRACYPVVEYAHGTGGDAYTFDQDGTAGRLAARGLAGISIDQPMHGLRAGGASFDVNLATFDFLNIEAPRGTFRQSAADTLSLTRFVRESLRVPAAVSPTGGASCFDPAHVLFFGHSQGGLSGALAASAGDLGAYALSGAGGGLSVTLMQRKTPVDIAAFMQSTLQPAPGETLDDLHPVVTLVQTLVDVTDPINYAGAWRAPPAPRNVVMTSGLDDQDTPYHTATALAVSGRVPVVQPLVTDMPEYAWAGLAPVSAPVSADVDGATAGLLQWASDGTTDSASHFLVFHRPEAIHAVMRFLQSAAYEGTAVIERDPTSNDR